MQPTRRSTLFLMELMLSILLFSLAATVCVQVFVKSHTLAKDSTELTHAVFTSTSVADIFRSSADYEDLLLQEFPHTVADAGNYMIHLDENFTPVSSEGPYILSFTTDTEAPYIIGHISVYSSSNEASIIYELNVKKYCPKVVE